MTAPNGPPIHIGIMEEAFDSFVVALCTCGWPPRGEDPDTGVLHMLGAQTWDDAVAAWRAHAAGAPAFVIAAPNRDLRQPHRYPQFEGGEILLDLR